MQPQIAHHRQRFLRPPEVAGEHDIGQLGPADDLAHLAQGYLVVMVVDDFTSNSWEFSLPGEPGLLTSSGVCSAIKDASLRPYPALLVAQPKRSRQAWLVWWYWHRHAHAQGVANLVGVVLGVGDECRQGAEHRDNCRTRALDFGPEARNRKAAAYARSAAHKQRPNDTHRKGTEAKQGQGCENDIVRVTTKRPCDLLSQRDKVVVGQHATLGRPGRARGVDEARQIQLAPAAERAGLQPTQALSSACQS